jgi:molecular chaperone HtpG
MSEAEAQSHVFQADVARLLYLMVHSVYSDRNIFLRELLSNAADACEKLRYEAISNPSLMNDETPFGVKITIAKEAGKLIVEDNGIGMSREELSDSLGTIARSGTRAFLDRLAAENGNGEGQSAGAELIGQFGIGFYAAYMVAERVDVESRRAGSNEAFVWSSDGKGTFTIAPLPLDQAPSRGTRVILTINEASKEYLEDYRIERIVSEYSGALAIPIELIPAPGGEAKHLTDGGSLWDKPKSSITPEQYEEFYNGLSGQFDKPLLTLHWRAEGRYEYTVLAFVPGSPPFDLFDPARKGKSKLYVRHVLIAPDADLLPSWLRFVRLVVDTADLPLNLSREMIQESPIFGAIKKGITNRVLQELTKLAETDTAAFETVWEHFGGVLKEGLYEDPERRDALFKFARFATSTHPDGKRTLQDYVSNLRENQTAIYYLLGDDLKRLGVSPQIEGFRARGIEVLLLPDPVDAFWVGTAVGFDGKPFKSVTQGVADIKVVPLKEGTTPPETEANAAGLASLFALMKQELQEVVADVRSSDRLSESPACLIAPETGLDRRLERMLAEHGHKNEATKPIFEVNPTHPLLTALAAQVGNPDKSVFADIVWLLFDEARLMEGEKPSDAPKFADRLTRILVKAAAQPSI